MTAALIIAAPAVLVAVWIWRTWREDLACDADHDSD